MTAALISSLLFAAWHVIPSVWSTPSDTEAAVLVGAPARPRRHLPRRARVLLAAAQIGSLLAPFLAHVATNSIAALSAWLVAD